MRAPAIILITSGILIIGFGIQEKNTRRIADRLDQDARLAADRERIAHEHAMMDAKIASDQLAIQNQYERRMAQIEAERLADQNLQQRAALWPSPSTLRAQAEADLRAAQAAGFEE